jgi:hypothetical protein
LGTAGFFLGGLSDALASVTNPIGSLWNLGEASYTVAQRDGDVAGVAYGLGSLIGATQATEAVEGENFLTGQALTGLDRWGMAFQSISAASGVAAVGLGVAGQLDFSGLFGRTAAGSTAVPEAFARELQGGGSWLMTRGQFARFAEGQSTIGRADGQFMTSAARMNQLIEETGGDPVLLGQKLGVKWEPGVQLIRMDVSNPLLFNPRLPSAPMIGANASFVPGGMTVGGVPEIVTDQLPWHEVWATPVAPAK